MPKPVKTSRTPAKRRPIKSSRKRDDLLEKALAAFLKNRRGTTSLGIFAASVGLPKASIARYEACEQSVTLQALQRIMKALNASLADIFGDATNQKV